jgi:hypothetical protein
VKYTDNRGYPYPASAREAGNGGLASEVLARAVAADLDYLDAGWAGEMQHSAVVLRKNTDQTGINASSATTFLMDILDKKTTGLGLGNSTVALSVVAGGEGWYHVNATLHSKASGAITAGAQHRLQLQELYTNSYGNFAERRVRYTETFQQGVTDNYNQLNACVYLGLGDQVRMQLYHTNTGSTATIVASGSRLIATKIVGA